MRVAGGQKDLLVVAVCQFQKLGFGHSEIVEIYEERRSTRCNN